MTHAFRHEPRQRLTRNQRAKLFLEKDGKCHRCGRKLRSGERWVAEHLLALSVGGDNSPDNWGVTCTWCLPEKNREDSKKAAKGRAVVVSCYVPRERGKWKREGMRYDWKARRYVKIEAADADT
jgi:HNH endonuclease